MANEELVIELGNAIRELVEVNGAKVGLGTDACKVFKTSHENCVGCQYELGCSKQVRLMLTTFTPSKQEDLIDTILAAKTVDEVKMIPIPEPETPYLPSY